MTKPQFISQLSAAFRDAGSDFNTCNSWGFGGAAGRQWKFNGVRVLVGRAYSRHLPPVDVVTVTVDGRRTFDELQRDADWELLFDHVMEASGLSRSPAEQAS